MSSLSLLPRGPAGDDATVLERLAPFAACCVVAFALVPVSGGRHVRWAELLALSLSVALGVAALLVRRLTSRSHAAGAALAAIAVVGLLRDATGGSTGGYGVLVIVPVLWVALYGSRPQLWPTLLGVAAMFVLPLAFVGAPRYPLVGWRSTPLLLLCCAIAGVVVQELLARERASAEREQRTNAQRSRLLSVMGDGLIVADRGGRVLEVNAALCDMTSYAAEEVVGQRAPLPSWPAADHERLSPPIPTRCASAAASSRRASSAETAASCSC